MGTSLPGRNRYIAESTLRAVLARFGVENPAAIKPHEASKRNDNFLVDGSDAKYLLRRYRRNNDEARVRFQLRFQEHLRVSGFPTSEIISSTGGDSLVCDESGLWALFAYVDGNEFDFSNTAQVAGAARWLAEFHRMAALFDCPEVLFDANREWCDWWRDGESEIGELASMFGGRDVDDDLAFLRDWWSESIWEWPPERVAQLPRGWMHGDWHGRNMVFVGDEVRGVFDFDPVRRGVIVEDVARAVFMFGRESRASRHIRLDVARVFLEDYDHLHELSAEELNALPFVMVAHLAPTVGYWRMLERDDEDAAAHLHHTVGLMQDLMPEAERLQHILDLSK
jgi:Ser/Thr protein kinase RdoA (MazF antagonist)